MILERGANKRRGLHNIPKRGFIASRAYYMYIYITSYIFHAFLRPWCDYTLLYSATVVSFFSFFYFRVTRVLSQKPMTMYIYSIAPSDTIARLCFVIYTNIACCIQHSRGCITQRSRCPFFFLQRRERVLSIEHILWRNCCIRRRGKFFFRARAPYRLYIAREAIYLVDLYYRLYIERYGWFFLPYMCVDYNNLYKHRVFSIARRERETAMM